MKCAKKSVLIIIVALSLSACKPENSGARAIDSEAVLDRANTTLESPSADELMKTLLGDSIRVIDGRPIAELVDPENRTLRRAFVVQPLLSATLSSGESVLVVNAAPVDDSGEINESHSAPGYLNVFVFTTIAGKLQVAARHENIDGMGTFGFLGKVSWVNLGYGRSAIAISHGGTWQGYSKGYLSVFEVSQTAVRRLADNVRILASNEGACLEPPECWSVTADVKYRLSTTPGEYPDIELDFTGRLPSEGEEIDQPYTAVSGTAIYRMTGEYYELSQGDNPVPEI